MERWIWEYLYLVAQDINMEKEYRVRGAMKASYTILTVMLGGAWGFVFSQLAPSQNWALFAVLLLLICGALILLSIFTTKLVIVGDAISISRFFYKRTLPNEFIKGVRFRGRRIHIESNNEKYRGIMVFKYNDFENWADMSSRFRGFKDLDGYDKKQSLKAILSEERLGTTEVQRQVFYDRMRGFATAYAIWGPLSAIAFILFDHVIIAVIAGIIYPLLGVVLMKSSKGLVKFTINSVKSAHISITIGFLPPVFVVLAKMLLYGNILSFSNWTLPAALLSFVAFAALYLTGRDATEGAIKGQVLIIALAAALFGFGNTAMVNCKFDRSAPLDHRATIANKYISSGKTTQYHLAISAWATGEDGHELTVSKSKFGYINVGSSITVHEKKGLLNMPWYYIDL